VGAAKQGLAWVADGAPGRTKRGVLEGLERGLKASLGLQIRDRIDVWRSDAGRWRIASRESVRQAGGIVVYTPVGKKITVEGLLDRECIVFVKGEKGKEPWPEAPMGAGKRARQNGGLCEH